MSDFVFFPPFYNTSEINYKNNWYVLDKRLNIVHNDDKKIKYIKLLIQKGTVNEGQTAITYHYLDDEFSEICSELTGMIQNTDRVWAHPPRTRSFEMLEINPFPEIRYPLKINKQWKSELKVSENWGNQRTFMWEGILDINTKYKITDKIKLNTRLGILDCYKVYAQSHNEYGFSELVAFYNEEYGFVKLEYSNMDKSKLYLTLFDLKHN